MREITLTELIQGYCEQGLGLPPSNHQPVDTALIYERILTEVDNRIVACLDIRIPELEEPLLNQLEERIAFLVDARISSQIALLEQRMATQLGEHIREGFSRACEVGRELERAKQQSPYPDGKTSESAIGEDAITVNSLDDMALGDIGEVKNASVGNMVEDSPALAAPSSELVEDSKLVPPAPKSQPTRRVIRSNGTENTLKAVNPI